MHSKFHYPGELWFFRHLPHAHDNLLWNLPLSLCFMDYYSLLLMAILGMGEEHWDRINNSKPTVNNEPVASQNLWALILTYASILHLVRRQGIQGILTKELTGFRGGWVRGGDVWRPTPVQTANRHLLPIGSFVAVALHYRVSIWQRRPGKINEEYCQYSRERGQGLMGNVSVRLSI